VYVPGAVIILIPLPNAAAPLDNDKVIFPENVGAPVVLLITKRLATPLSLIVKSPRAGKPWRTAHWLPPALVLDHTVPSNGNHGPTIQFVHDGSGARQWVIGTNGPGTRIDFGYSDSGYGNTNYNPHNGIGGYQGKTVMRMTAAGMILGDLGTYPTVHEPTYALEVRGVIQTNGLSVNDNELHLRSWADPTHKFYYASGDVDVWEYNTKIEFRQYNGGGTRLTKMGFTSGGTMTVTEDVVAYGSPSDISLKTNIQPLEGSLEKILKLQGVSFDWKEDTTSNQMVGIKEDIGFIAQQVKEIVPELVRTNENGLMSLRDKGITAILVEAIKEQQTQIESQKTEIEELKDLVKQLINR